MTKIELEEIWLAHMNKARDHARLAASDMRMNRFDTARTYTDLATFHLEFATELRRCKGATQSATTRKFK